MARSASNLLMKIVHIGGVVPTKDLGCQTRILNCDVQTLKHVCPPVIMIVQNSAVPVFHSRLERHDFAIRAGKVLEFGLTALFQLKPARKETMEMCGTLLAVLTLWDCNSLRAVYDAGAAISSCEAHRRSLFSCRCAAMALAVSLTRDWTCTSNTHATHACVQHCCAGTSSALVKLIAAWFIFSL